MNRRLRRVWLKIHRWLGLTAGMLLVVIGLSGSVLVFQHAIDEWLNANLLIVKNSGSRRPLADVLAAIEGSLEPDESVQFVDAPRHDRGVWTAWVRNSAKKDRSFVQIYVNPYSANVTGRRVWGEYAITWIYSLHRQLLAGLRGESVVGICGIILVISILTGVILWWPLWRNSWRAAFVIRRGSLLDYDLHKTIGIIGGLTLLVAAVSGVYLEFPNWIRPLVISAGSPGRAEDLDSIPGPGSERIDADQALESAEKALPEAELKRLYLPSDPEDAYIARVRQPGEVRRSMGNSRVWIDQYSGQVRGVRDWNNQGLAETILDWQFPLHNGEAFGLVGRWIVFVTGLIPGILYVTGGLLWWRKRQARKRQRQICNPSNSSTPPRQGHRSIQALAPLCEQDQVE